MVPWSPSNVTPGAFGRWRRWECQCGYLNAPTDPTCFSCGKPRTTGKAIVIIGREPMTSSSVGEDGRFGRGIVILLVVCLIILMLSIVGIVLRLYIVEAPAKVPHIQNPQQITPTPGPKVYRGNTLVRGESLNPGNYLLSINGRYNLVFQRDGNLVEYDHMSQNGAIWASNTQNEGATIAELQSDGNFVIYPDKPGFVLFATGTNVSKYRTSGYRLVVQNNGEIVIYDVDNRVLWHN